jgi:predicted transcriptional regulator YdeE
VPAPKKYSVEPIDLMPEQSERLIRAIAVYDAKCAALDAGMSVAEVDAQTWVVEIHPSEDRTSK